MDKRIEVHNITFFRKSNTLSLESLECEFTNLMYSLSSISFIFSISIYNNRQLEYAEYFNCLGIIGGRHWERKKTKINSDF